MSVSKVNSVVEIFSLVLNKLKDLNSSETDVAVVVVQDDPDLGLSTG